MAQTDNNKRHYLCMVTIPITQAKVKENWNSQNKKPFMTSIKLKHKAIKQWKKRNMCKVRYKTNAKKEKKYV